MPFDFYFQPSQIHRLHLLFGSFLYDTILSYYLGLSSAFSKLFQKNSCFFETHVI
nr:MAG TPA: hypothetical protein [Caudoviricetes sp.]